MSSIFSVVEGGEIQVLEMNLSASSISVMGAEMCKTCNHSSFSKGTTENKFAKKGTCKIMKWRPIDNAMAAIK